MTSTAPIPAFNLYGEQRPFPDVIHVETFSARAPIHDWTISPHRHGAMAQLFRIDKGFVAAKTDGSKWQLSDRSYLYVPERTVHEFQFQPDTEGRVFSFPLNVIDAIGPDGRAVRAALSRPVSGILAAPLSSVLDALVLVFDGTATHRREQTVSLAQAALSLVAEEAAQDTQSGRASARVQALDALIAEHVADGWSASDYASALALTTGHLSRLCRAAAGVGAATYIEQKVMEEARRLLAFTRLPVSAVGYRLGFNDPSYFTKRFTKVTGETPSTYRIRFAQD